MTKKVKVIDIVRTDETQMRVSLDRDTVEAYRDLYAYGHDMPPLGVYEVGRRMILVDGFHRLAAAVLASRESIMVNVMGSGTMDDAVECALGLNHKHGLRRSNADKRRAVEMALAHPKLKSASSRIIGDMCGVDHSLVTKIRKVDCGSTTVEHVSIGNDSCEEKPDTIPPPPNEDIIPKSVAEAMKPPKPVKTPPAERVKGKDGKWRKKHNSPGPRAGLPDEECFVTGEKQIRALANTLMAWSREVAYEGHRQVLETTAQQLKVAAAGLAQYYPTRCPLCDGFKKDCQQCKEVGWLPRFVAERASQHLS